MLGFLTSFVYWLRIISSWKVTILQFNDIYTDTCNTSSTNLYSSAFNFDMADSTKLHCSSLLIAISFSFLERPYLVIARLFLKSLFNLFSILSLLARQVCRQGSPTGQQTPQWSWRNICQQSTTTRSGQTADQVNLLESVCGKMSLLFEEENCENLSPGDFDAS